MRHRITVPLAALIALSLLAALAAPAAAMPTTATGVAVLQADFEEDTPLTPIPIDVARGTGIAMGGASPCECGAAGMTITLPPDPNPDDGVEIEVKQALLYWYGAFNHSNSPTATAQIGVDVDQLQTVSGVQIGGPAYFFMTGGERVYFSSFRADVTDLVVGEDWLTPGVENLLMIDLPFTPDEIWEEGAGMMVIYDDGSTPTPLIQIQEGLDLAFFNFPEPYRQRTEPVAFTFPVTSRDRDARVYLMIASEGDEDYARRPNDMVITVGGESMSYPCYGTCTSLWWDSHDLGNVPVPAGVDGLSVEVISRPVNDPPEELGASLAWIVAAVLTPSPIPAIDLDRTSGTWSYTIDNTDSSAVDLSYVEIHAGPGVMLDCPSAKLDAGQTMTCQASGPAAYHARAAWVYAEPVNGMLPMVIWVPPE